MTRFQRGCRAAGALIAVAATLGAARAGETITVRVDQATLAAVPERVATLVVGNPAIADVSLQPGRLLVVTGKSYGVTNLIALDRGGAVLMERSIEVRETRENVVYVYRGVTRESYSCAPFCERRINLGDTPDYFNATLGQSAARNNLAGSSALPPVGAPR